MFRVGKSEAGRFADAPVYRTTMPVNHAPFSPRKNGPYPKGASLGMSLGDWLRATGKFRYTCTVGDKARIDEDGFVYLTGRVKDYFKTIQGKFVAPTPIENEFSKNPHTEQLCLLGRGYSKTVMVCVLSALAQQGDQEEVANDLKQLAESVNAEVDKHARIGAVIITTEHWTIDNRMLTPTLKIRREQIDGRYGERAQELAQNAAVQGELLVEWI